MIEFEDFVRAELTAMREQLSDLPRIRALVEDIPRMRALVDGIPLLGSSIGVLHRSARELRADFNDFARNEVTPGEIAALNTDADEVRTPSCELAMRLATIERRLEELEKQR